MSRKLKLLWTLPRQSEDIKIYEHSDSQIGDWKGSPSLVELPTHKERILIDDCSEGMKCLKEQLEARKVKEFVTGNEYGNH
jgi:hypothetical protein